MTRHPLDGDAIAADAHYGREQPEMRECDQCDGTGTIERENSVFKCGTCRGSGQVPVEQDEPEAQERDE